MKRPTEAFPSESTFDSKRKILTGVIKDRQRLKKIITGSTLINGALFGLSSLTWITKDGQQAAMVGFGGLAANSAVLITSLAAAGGAREVEKYLDTPDLQVELDEVSRQFNYLGELPEIIKLKGDLELIGIDRKTTEQDIFEISKKGFVKRMIGWRDLKRGLAFRNITTNAFMDDLLFFRHIYGQVNSSGEVKGRLTVLARDYQNIILGITGIDPLDYNYELDLIHRAAMGNAAYVTAFDLRDAFNRIQKGVASS